MVYALGVLFVATLIVVVILALQLGKTQKAVHVASAEKDALSRQAAALASQVQALARYQHIINAEVAAAQMHDAARQHAGGIVAHAQQEANRIAAQAQATLATATSNAARVVETAKTEAEQVIRSARAAAEEAKRLEATADAMRNVIEGYGDRYIQPSAGLLDDLADEFGFTEAGQQLKVAREHARKMIRKYEAATCEYAEASRRATAIEFVLDAFNGKVDTILADVCDDNYGTLEQKIRDAFHLVNQNGAAFRDARITPAYLAARIEELRWAVIAQELKLKQREEQRLLKERIREEERAQREFERAQKDAEKEEDVLRKAMDKARREIEKATDEQKLKYEAQLHDLEEKSRVAEEKSQRALSMAQQTKAGHVYVISNVGSFGENVFKIGLTRRLEPLDRIRELGDASVPFEFDVHALIRSDDAPALEHALHQQFVRNQVNKVNARKEFFRLTLHEIHIEVDRLGIQTAWTMVAEAREYRETLAVERALETRAIDEKAWAAQQVREHDVAVALREPAEVN